MKEHESVSDNKKQGTTDRVRSEDGDRRLESQRSIIMIAMLDE